MQYTLFVARCCHNPMARQGYSRDVPSRSRLPEQVPFAGRDLALSQRLAAAKVPLSQGPARQAGPTQARPTRAGPTAPKSASAVLTSYIYRQFTAVAAAYPAMLARRLNGSTRLARCNGSPNCPISRGCAKNNVCSGQLPADELPRVVGKRSPCWATLRRQVRRGQPCDPQFPSLRATVGRSDVLGRTRANRRTNAPPRKRNFRPTRSGAGRRGNGASRGTSYERANAA